ncbi:MAG: myo-inosose-2 dehydratase [Gammaproteobacteria bacterium]
MAVRLGVAPIAWSNDDLPELGGDTPLETCLAESREAGYSGTETGGKFPMDPLELGPLLERYELALVSGWFSGQLLQHSVEAELGRMRDQFQTFAALGAPVLVYAETTGSVQGQRDVRLSRRPRLSTTELGDYGTKLTELAQRMADGGVPMAYHHHMGTVIETESEVDSLMAATGEAVGLLVDTGHITYAGGDPVKLLRRHGPRVNHIHCKDVREEVLRVALERDQSFLEAVLAGVFTVPGDGRVDFGAVAAATADIGYAGWLVVEAEQDPAKANPLEYARMGHRHLSGVLQDAGIEVVTSGNTRRATD